MIGKSTGVRPDVRASASAVASRTSELSSPDADGAPDTAVHAADNEPGDKRSTHGRDGTGDGEAAVQARRQAARDRADRYLAELIREVGEPSPQEVAEAEAWADRIEQALEKARSVQ